MARPSPLDVVREWVLVEPTDIGPVIFRTCQSWRAMLDLMTRWGAINCVGRHATLWRLTRRGWQIVGNQE